MLASGSGSAGADDRMRILVTGRGGQLARALAERGTGRNLVLAARPELDLARPATIERTMDKVRPDLVINAAAYTQVDRAEEEEALAFAVNAEAPGIIGRAELRIGARMLHVSTDYVFDGSGNRPWSEDDAPGPVNAYGRSKLAGEIALRDSGAPFAILRTSWLFSPFGRNFVTTMLALAREHDEVSVVADQFGNPTGARDLAGALLQIASTWRDEPDTETGGVFHFASPEPASWAEFARAIFETSRRLGGPAVRVEEITSDRYPGIAARPANSRMDCSRFAEVFGYNPPDWRGELDKVVRQLLTSDE